VLISFDKFSNFEVNSFKLVTFDSVISVILVNLTFISVNTGPVASFIFCTISSVTIPVLTGIANSSCKRFISGVFALVSVLFIKSLNILSIFSSFIPVLNSANSFCYLSNSVKLVARCSFN